MLRAGGRGLFLGARTNKLTRSGCSTSMEPATPTGGRQLSWWFHVYISQLGRRFLSIPLPPVSSSQYLRFKFSSLSSFESSEMSPDQAPHLETTEDRRVLHGTNLPTRLFSAKLSECMWRPPSARVTPNQSLTGTSFLHHPSLLFQLCP